MLSRYAVSNDGDGFVVRDRRQNNEIVFKGNLHLIEDFLDQQENLIRQRRRYRCCLFRRRKNDKSNSA